MENSEFRQRVPASSHSLRDAIREVRIKEAQTIDDAAERRSSELARLEILKAALEKVFDEIPKSDDRFELALVPSFPARLWIDMFTSVAMDEASRIYRLIRNGRQGRRVLAETSDVSEMAERVVEYIARQIIERERQMEGLVAYERQMCIKEGVRSPRSRVYLATGGFLIGLLTGIVGLFAIGYLITM